ncbi:MAG: DUF1819 family protein [Caldilinea sp.]
MSRYSMSFTSGTLLHRESLTIVELYTALQDWEQVRCIVLADNRLQMRTANASQRLYREIASRLRQLTADELALLQCGSLLEQAYLLWLAVCKRYRFIYDFAGEVVREKFLRLDFELKPEEYDIFFARKAEWHPEVESVAPATRSKQRQVVYKMLREAQLVGSDRRIIPALLTPRLIDAIRADDPAHFVIFPISEMERQRWMA